MFGNVRGRRGATHHDFFGWCLAGRGREVVGRVRVLGWAGFEI